MHGTNIKQLTSVLSLFPALNISASDAATFPVDTCTPLPSLWIRLKLRVGLKMISGTHGECLLASYILFVPAVKWNTKYVAASLPVPNNMAGFR
jgi:hypothetical protein